MARAPDSRHGTWRRGRVVKGKFFLHTDFTTRCRWGSRRRRAAARPRSRRPALVRCPNHTTLQDHVKRSRAATRPRTVACRLAVSRELRHRLHELPLDGQSADRPCGEKTPAGQSRGYRPRARQPLRRARIRAVEDQLQYSVYLDSFLNGSSDTVVSRRDLVFVLQATADS
jgi:hypothetical protein